MSLDLGITDSLIADSPGTAAHKIEKLAERIEAGEFDPSKGFADLVNQINGLRLHVLACAIRNLSATKRFWSKNANDWCVEPDGNVQMKAVVWIASYSDGLPTQTTLNVNIGDKPNGELDLNLEAAVQRSPALKERLQKLVGPVVETEQKRVRK